MLLGHILSIVWRMRNKLVLRFVVGVWLLAIALFTYAEQQVDLYSSSTLVLNQSSQIRHQAAADALANVFVRISGNREIVKHDAIQQALAKAKSYLYEFEYSSTDEMLEIAGVKYTAIRLLTKFSARLVDGLLKSKQLPYWPTNRPDVLLWAAKADAKGGQQFIDNDAPVTNAFTRTAKERGVTLVKPIFDLEDRLALPISRLWASDVATISKASARYQTDAVLSGRFSPLDKGRWRGSFTLFYQAQETSFVAYGEDVQTIAMNIFEQVADYFSEIFTSVIDNQSSLETLVLTVNNVNDFAVYANLLSYVESFPMVQEINLMVVKANRIQLMLHYRGAQAVVFRTLALDKHLIQIESKTDTNFSIALDSTAVPQGTVANPLQFLWHVK